MIKYTVIVSRTEVKEIVIEVTARDSKEAERFAMDEAANTDFTNVNSNFVEYSFDLDDSEEEEGE